MDKIQCHAVIQCLKKNGSSSQTIPEHMIKTSGEYTPSYTMVKKSLAEFRRQRQHSRWLPSWRKTCNCHVNMWPSKNLGPSYGLPMSNYKAHSHYFSQLTSKCSSHSDQRTGYDKSISHPYYLSWTWVYMTNCVPEVCMHIILREKWIFIAELVQWLT